MKRKERRAAKRFGLQLTGTVTFNIKGRERLQSEVTTRDLSAQGAYLLTDTCPSVGERVRLRLEGASEPKITLQTVGTVVRVEQLSEKTCGFAVKFDEIVDLGET